MKEAADKAVKEKSGIMIGVQMNLTKLYARFFQMLYLLILQLTLQCPSAVGTPLMAKSNRIEVLLLCSHLTVVEAQAAARAHRAGSKSNFLIAGNCHPIVEWAEEPEVNPEELAKTKIAFVRNLPADADENYLKLFDPLGKLDRVVLSKKGHYPAGFVHFAKRAIDIQSVTSVKELPESGAISILVQFMLLGPEENNKAEYLAGLISRKQVDKLGLNQHALNLSMIGDVASKESELSCFSNRVHLPTADPLASRVGLTVARYDSYASLYSSSLSAQRLSSRVGFGKMEESSPTPLHQTPDSSSTSYSKVRLDYLHIAAADCQHTRPQVRFDPFTGEPCKFDPFTGEPILPESLP